MAAVLKENNYDVEILNWHNINATPEKIKDIIVEKKPEVIGFSILHGNRWGGIEIARIAKTIDPTVTIVFGGVGATFLWEHFLSHFSEVDYVVIGEGEHTFLNLVKHLESDHLQKIETLNGLAYRKNGQAFRTADAAAVNRLDDLPDPAKYFTYQHLSLTRGCAGNCNFCGSPRFWGRNVRFHSADYFVGQLQRLYQKGIRFFYFSDDTFTVDKKLFAKKNRHRRDPKCFRPDPEIRYHGPGLFYLRLPARKPANHPGYQGPDRPNQTFECGLLYS